MAPRTTATRNARAQRLAAARMAAGITQVQAAAAAGIDASTLSRIERGAADPPLDALVALCEAYGVSTDSILREQTP